MAIKAYANCDYSLVVWHPGRRVKDCRGFALYRRYTGAQPEVVDTWVGFDGERAPPGTQKPSTVWPIQKFMWADLLVESGREVSYRAVPMVGPDRRSLEPAERRGTEWSDPVSVTPTATRSLASYFNRGIVASQWLARRLPQTGGTSAMSRRLERIVNTVGDPIRDFLAGEIRTEMLELLDGAGRDGRTVFAVLYELNDTELIDALKALGARSRVVLAVLPGDDGEDENADAADALEAAGVELHRRRLGSGHIAHNKFLVVCDASGRPRRVWTGSTNWTRTGLCTQANNGLLVDSPKVAGWFHDQWVALRDAQDEFPGALLEHDDVRRSVRLGEARLTTWFTPVSDTIDLEDARRHILHAEHGVLFLMFNPGPRGTLLNDIIELASPLSESYNPGLYIHGVVNQDPGTKKNPVQLFHRSERNDVDFEVVLPAAVNETLGFWVRELRKLNWKARAMVHSKCIVVDPFGARPVVITGSHNLGPKASGKNDDNMVIVENAPGLAADYAVNIIGIYNQYRWRWRMLQRERARAAGVATRAREWRGLEDGDGWQNGYLRGRQLSEIEFWLGGGT